MWLIGVGCTSHTAHMSFTTFRATTAYCAVVDMHRLRLIPNTMASNKNVRECLIERNGQNYVIVNY